MKKNYKSWRIAAVVFLTSAAILPIRIPPDYGSASGSYDEERVEGFIKQVLVFTGDHGWKWWHFLTNFPNGKYMVFRDTRTGALHKVFTEDTVKVYFAKDNSKMLLWMAGPFAPSTGFFQVLPGSERRADGTCYVRGCSQDHLGKTRDGNERGFVTAISAPIYTARWTWGSTPTEMENW